MCVAAMALCSYHQLLHSGHLLAHYMSHRPIPRCSLTSVPKLHSYSKNPLLVKPEVHLSKMHMYDDSSSETLTLILC
jgi:hypothetical protein